MPKWCKQLKQKCWYYWHLEHSFASNVSAGNVITMLRDPVERFLSEFQMLRGKEAYHLRHEQWDYEERDLPLLGKLSGVCKGSGFERMKGCSSRASDAMPEGEALMRFMRLPFSPARNRQALYVLGFRRLRCRETGGRSKDGTCTRPRGGDDGGHPGQTYDWDRHGSGLVARAKAQLEGLLAFGIMDCFAASLRAVARSLGWDEAQVASKAGKVRARANSLKDREAPQARNGTAAAASWRSQVSEDVALELVRLNAVDAELLAFARQRLYEIHGTRCEAPS